MKNADMSSEQDQVANAGSTNNTDDAGTGKDESRSSENDDVDDDSSSSSTSSSGWDEEESSRPAKNSTPRRDNGIPRYSSSSQHTHVSFAEHQFRERRDSVDESVHGAPPSTPSRAQPQQQQQQQQAVPEDQERQILLVMLLAQVCALHDPTPRTFTVHVLELFERGILDRQSIHFLYSLGLIPTHKQPLQLPPSEPSTTQTKGALAMIPTANASKNLLRQRSIEASAIRNTLENHEKLLRSQSDDCEHAPAGHPNDNSPQQEHPSSVSWSVDEHPLSLSRYQREFEQIGLLASGSFGQVFQACSKMDGREYAIKRVPFAATGYSNESVQTVVREVRCLAVCDHPNVVRYYTSWLEPSWMTGSSTFDNNNSSNSNDEHQLKLLTDLHHIVSGDGTSAEDLKDDLKEYFKDPSFGVAAHRRASSLDNVFFDASASSWGNNGDDDDEDVSEWTIDQSKDDIFVGGYRGSSSSQRRNSARFQQQTDDFDPWRQGRQQRQKRKVEKSHYQYQICLFIQMELCHPATLADWIRARNQKMGDQSFDDRLETAAEIFDQIVAGLEHVHERGRIVHRDLKPSNIFASADGLHFKIGDFGLSKLIESAASKSTGSPARRSGRFHRQQQLLLLQHENTRHKRDGSGDDADTSWQDPWTAGVGTASYASPEQVSTRNYCTQADIYSLGLILLELLCCFSTEHERLQTFHDCRHRRELPPELKEYPLVAETILACTELKPEKRPTAADLMKINLKSNSFQRCNINTKHEDTVESLKLKLVEKEKEVQKYKTEVVEKDCTINDLRREVARLRRSNQLSQQQSSYSSPATSKQRDAVSSSASSSSSSEDGI